MHIHYPYSSTVFSGSNSFFLEAVFSEQRKKFLARKIICLYWFLYNDTYAISLVNQVFTSRAIYIGSKNNARCPHLTQCVVISKFSSYVQLSIFNVLWSRGVAFDSVSIAKSFARSAFQKCEPSQMSQFISWSPPRVALACFLTSRFM